MDRPNIATSPKSVQHYVERLEQELDSKDAQIATLTRDATVADDWRGPFVAYLDGADEQTPLARVREGVHFIPHADRSVHVSVRWSPDDEAIEVMSHSPRGVMLIQPQAANVVRIRQALR